MGFEEEAHIVWSKLPCTLRASTRRVRLDGVLSSLSQGGDREAGGNMRLKGNVELVESSMGHTLRLLSVLSGVCLPDGDPLSGEKDREL